MGLAGTGVITATGLRYFEWRKSWQNKGYAGLAFIVLPAYFNMVERRSIKKGMTCTFSNPGLGEDAKNSDHKS